MGKSKVILIILAFLIVGTAYADIGRSGLGTPRVWVEETDGDPSGIFRKLIFDNNTLNKEGAHVHVSTTPLNDSLYIRRDGTKSPTADIPWGDNKITGLTDPTNPQDAATKEYVDTAFEGIMFDFFFNDTVSDIGTIYNNMESAETGESESVHTQTIASDNTAIVNFATIVGEPTFTTLTAGVYQVHFHSDVNNVAANYNTATVFFRLYKRLGVSPFTETLLVTSEESGILTETATSYIIHGTLATETELSGERLVVKLLGNLDTEGRVNDPTVTIRSEGTNTSRIGISTTVSAFDDRYVEVKGDTMTGKLVNENLVSSAHVETQAGLHIPHEAAPTVSVVGDVAVDTNILDATMGSIIMHDGTQQVNLVGTTDSPANDEVPKYDSGTGKVTWEADTGTASPAGNDTEIQFNDGGSAGADSDFTWDKTNNIQTNAGLNASAHVEVQAGADFNDINITNVGNIDLDLIRADAADGTVTIELDNAVGADLLIGNSNALVVEGDTNSVGIGTNDPDGSLAVSNEAAGSGTPIILIENATGNTQLDPHLRYAVGATPQIKWSVGIDDSATDDPLVFAATTGVGGSQVMTLERGGQIGIGVIDPDTKLEIFNAGVQLKLSYDANSFVTFSLDASDDLTIKPAASGGIRFQPTTTDTTDFFQVLDQDGGTPVFNVDATNERVGIGTASPNAPLEVKDDFQGVIGGFASGILHITNKGTDANDNAVITGHNNSSTNKQLWYLGSTANTNDNIAFINRQNGTLSFSTNNTQRLTIDAAGNVGIGVTNPVEELDVAGNIRSTDLVSSAHVEVQAGMRVPVNIAKEPKHLRFNIFNPGSAYDTDPHVCVWPKTDASITFTGLEITLNTANLEICGDLKYADAFIGLASATRITDANTISGVKSTAHSVSVAANKAIYYKFEADPNDAITQAIFDVKYSYD